MSSPLLKRQYEIAVLRKSAEFSSASKVHLGISVPHRKHGGVELAIMVDWAARNYDAVQIDLYDTIQRHNFSGALGVDNAKAYQMAIEAGDKWIEKNSHIWGSYKNVSFKRYNELKALFPEAEERLTLLENLYSSDEIFMDIIDREIISYLERKQSREPGWSSEKFETLFQHSKAYILDELSVMSLLGETENYLEIYSGTFLNLPTDPERLKIKDLPLGLKHYPVIEVEFKRVKFDVPELKAG